MLPVWVMQPIPYFGEKLGGDWIVEPKIDGWRMEIIKDGKIEFWGRRLEKKPNWTKKLNIPINLLNNVPDGTILDSELYSEKGRRFIPSLFTLQTKVKPIILIFDIIFYNYEFVGNLSLKERKELLKKLNFFPPFYLIEYKKLNDINEHINEAISKGYEGIVIKRLDSPYEISKDGPIATVNWRKIKPK